MTSIPAALDRDANVGERPQLFDFAKTYITIVLLFILVQGNGLFSNAFSVEVGSTDMEHNSMLALLNLFLWTVSAWIILPKVREALKALIANWALLLVAILAPLSSLWSTFPLITFRRALLMDMAILLGAYFIKKYSSEDLFKLFLATGVVVALASISMAIMLPQYGRMPTGEWKGIFWHKNQLAQAMELLFSPLFFYEFGTQLSRLLAIGMAMLGIGTMAMSQSRTGMLLTLVFLGMALFARAIRRLDESGRPVVFYSVFLILVVAIPAILGNTEAILTALGKDPSLTGRLNTWPLLIPFVYRHWFCGYGYSGFWTGFSGDSGSALSGMHGYMNTADNGYIDMALQFGIVGIICLLLLLGTAVLNFTNLAKRRRVPISAFWYMGFILDAILGNLSGTFFFEPNGIATLTLAMVCLGLSHLRKLNPPEISPGQGEKSLDAVTCPRKTQPVKTGVLS